MMVVIVMVVVAVKLYVETSCELATRFFGKQRWSSVDAPQNLPAPVHGFFNERLPKLSGDLVASSLTLASFHPRMCYPRVDAGFKLPNWMMSITTWYCRFRSSGDIH
jgi:hypothetical protein